MSALLNMVDRPVAPVWVACHPHAFRGGKRLRNGFDLIWRGEDEERGRTDGRAVGWRAADGGAVCSAAGWAAGEESSDDEDEVEEMWIVQDLLTSVCALEARLCEVEARLDEAEQQSISSSQRSMCARLRCKLKGSR